MDAEERAEFARQLQGVQKRAKREKAVITGLTWKDGHLRPLLVHATRPPRGEEAPPVAEPPPIPKKGRRSIIQTELPL